MLRRIQNIGKGAGGLILLVFLAGYLSRILPDGGDREPSRTLPENYRAQSFKVHRVIDGDSVVLRGDKGEIYEIRLQGVDAPEARQDYGPEAEKALQRRLRGEEVRLRTEGTDRYGRHIGYLEHEGEDINYWLIAQGHAWHYKRYNDDPAWALAEAHARSERIGLWKARRPVPPWEWRAEH
jgi:endonuclease YncB( thermonuclease family)